MRKEYNSQSFTPEEVEQGLHLKLLNVLLELNNAFKKRYNDIHIWTDGYCTIIDWAESYYDDVGEGRFEFVEGDEVIMVEKLFPDGHIELCEDEEDYINKLNSWRKKHKNWTLLADGTWAEGEKHGGK